MRINFVYLKHFLIIIFCFHFTAQTMEPILDLDPSTYIVDIDVSTRTTSGGLKFMQDFIYVGENQFHVLDGHGSDRVAKFLAHKEIGLASLIDYNIKQGMSVEKAIKHAYQIADGALKNSKNGYDKEGSTAISAVFDEDLLYIANLGNSGAILVTDRHVKNLITKHRPENKAEYLRIKALGGEITKKRVEGKLRITRSFGDFRYKEPVSRNLIISEPEILRFEIKNNYRYLILASDGLLDSVPLGELKRILTKLQKKDAKAEKVCKKLVREAVRRFRIKAAHKDNVAVIVIKFFFRENNYEKRPKECALI